jgi:hypothetical protein
LRKFILEKAKLGLNDGPQFGPGGSGFQRLNVACPRSFVEEAMGRLATMALSLGPHVIAAQQGAPGGHAAGERDGGPADGG